MAGEKAGVPELERMLQAKERFDEDYEDEEEK